VSKSPLTTLCGARSIANIASEKMAYCSRSVITQIDKIDCTHTGFLKSFL
jgi:hypothetical protein